MTEVSQAKEAGRFQSYEQLQYYLKDISRISLANIDDVIENLEIQVNEIGFNSLDMFMGLKDIQVLPCEEIGNGAKYFLAICYIMKGEYEKAEKVVEDILFIAQNIAPQSQTLTLLRVIYYYASAMNKIQDHEKVMEYMNLLFDKEISKLIDQNFKNQEEIIIRHYPITKEDYVENDDNYFLPFMQTLRNAQKENIIAQDSLSELFRQGNAKILTKAI